MVPGTPPFWTALSGELHTSYLKFILNINPLQCWGQSNCRTTRVSSLCWQIRHQLKTWRAVQKHISVLKTHREMHGADTHHVQGKLKSSSGLGSTWHSCSLLNWIWAPWAPRETLRSFPDPACPTGASSLPDTCSSVPMCKATPFLHNRVYGFWRSNHNTPKCLQFHHLTPTTQPKCSGWPQAPSVQRGHRSHPFDKCFDKSGVKPDFHVTVIQIWPSVPAGQSLHSLGIIPMSPVLTHLIYSYTNSAH